MSLDYKGILGRLSRMLTSENKESELNSHDKLEYWGGFLVTAVELMTKT